MAEPESPWNMTQWLCSARHCAFATVWERAATTEAELVPLIEKRAQSDGINMWCGICGGPIKAVTSHFPPSYQTREQVLAAMHASQQQQIASRALMDKLGTFDSRRADSRN